MNFLFRLCNQLCYHNSKKRLTRLAKFFTAITICSLFNVKQDNVTVELIKIDGKNTQPYLKNKVFFQSGNRAMMIQVSKLHA